MVAMRGLQRAEAHGVEFYSRDLSTRLSGWYVKHAEGAARYFEAMYGPLPRKVRMAQVWRERSMGYARTAYTVLSEGGRSTPDITEVNPGRYVAHEIAHARSEEHTSELQSLMRISYAVFCLKKKKNKQKEKT